MLLDWVDWVLLSHMETQRYDDGKTRGKAPTELVCALCFSEASIVPTKEVCQDRDLKGRTPLAICGHCFDLRLAIPVSGGRSNKRQMKQQGDAQKKRRFKAAVEAGNRRCRKWFYK